MTKAVRNITETVFLVVITLWCGAIAGALIDRAAHPEPEPTPQAVQEKIIVIIADPTTGRKEMFYFRDGEQYKMDRIPRGIVPQPSYSKHKKGCA